MSLLNCSWQRWHSFSSHTHYWFYLLFRTKKKGLFFYPSMSVHKIPVQIKCNQMSYSVFTVISPYRNVYSSMAGEFIGQQQTLVHLQYQSYCHLLLIVCVCAFKDHQCSRGGNEVVVEFASSGAIFRFWKITRLYKKDKMHWGGKIESTTQVGVRYWFTIMVQADCHTVHRVHLCHQKVSHFGLLLLGVSSVFFTLGLQRKQRMLSAAERQLLSFYFFISYLNTKYILKKCTE